MKTLLSFIKQRWFISLLGVLALGLFIWFLGPLFAFAEYEPLGPEIHRLGLIGAIAVFWLIIRIWTFFKAKNKSSQVLAALVTNSEPVLSADEQATQDELQTLKERLQEALTMLKKTRLGGFSGQQFLYQLPWYIIIGPPGAGKTTLLKNSDLKFPLSGRFGKEAIRGVGGTRNCDWWFADEAILLDTAGRYTTQDSHEKVDQGAWLGFLKLLKKYRSRRPINGAIIAVSLSDLLEQNKAEQQSLAISIRKRIQELHEHFNIRFPVYVLFTKCDLLAGFMEFFDELDRDKRAQVWGMTFKLEEEATIKAVEQFPSEFDILGQQLQNQLIAKLERERGRERRNLIYTFPQQFNSLNTLIQAFLDEVFQPTRFEYSVLLRGVYFTSATQEGSPIDRIMGSLANSFGLDRQNITTSASQGKSFFINRLLRQVIFAESGLAGANLKLENKRAWLQRGAFTAVGAITLLMAAVWLTSFVKNKAYIHEVAEQTASLQQQVNNLDPRQNDLLSVLPLLDRARHMPGGYAEQQEGTPWALDFGLYQGDKLGNAAVSLYRKLLKELFLSRLMLRIEQQLQNNTNNTDYLYEGLKAYLMLGEPSHYDRDVLRNWVTLDWKHNLPLEITNEQRQVLEDHLNTLLEVRPVPLPRPLNRELINQTRGLLENTPIAERIYGRLMLELRNNNLPDFRVSEKAGRDASLVLSSQSGNPLTKGVPGLFTCSGYRDVFLKNKERLINQQINEKWVLGTKQEKSLTDSDLLMLRENVLKHYLEDYIEPWEALLKDIQLKPFSSQTQMVEVLNIIAGENSPLRLFLEAVDQETSMNCLNKKDKTLLDKASEKLITARSTLDSIIKTTPEAQISARPEITTNLVTNHFKELHQLVQAKEGTPSPLEHSLSLLNELYVFLNSLLHASGDELVLEQRKQVNQVIGKVKLEGKRNPFPVNNLMNNIAEGSRNLLSGGIRNHINSMWKANALPFCQKAIQGLYPISSSSREITFEDFTYFFGPGGLMDEFFKKYLAASVEKKGQNWSWNKTSDTESGISSASLKQFQMADTIKNIFFRMGKQSPNVSFKLKPISMSADIIQFILDVDGQVLTYAHGPVRPVSMKWPGPNDSGQVRIQLLPPLGGNSGLSKEGPWALFRMFDEAQISRTSNPTLFIMNFNIQGREAKFELRADSAINPFQLTDLQSFKCLTNL
ncbi:IcmF1 [Candidatus Methylobacter favarea]|uniref:IcmF1 n=1 Tax=Candidatus Methylobacter favarea TaxID=2707345 RepID=A0A8S0WME5_9GAMM|nr:type VI secretion system membrane subunit TssM [Candidatus Methylobacter favarea]CAA9889690.1 IcmF1 [Candidatus Methylobacter favarea]